MTRGGSIKVKENSRNRIAEAVELVLSIGNGVLNVKDIETDEFELFAEHFACPYCDYNFDLAILFEEV